MAFEGKEERAPQAERSEKGEARIEAEAAAERRLEIAGRVGEEIGSYESRFAELEAEAAGLPEAKRAEILQAVGGEQRQALEAYPGSPDDVAARSAAVETGKADTAMAFKEEDLKRDRAELTARRVERASFAVGSSVAALAEAPRVAVERAVTPFLETSRGALGQVSETTAETIDKVAPSITRAAEDVVRKIGSAGAEVGGKLFNATVEPLAKLVEKVGGAGWAVMEKVIEKAPAAVARGIKAMIMVFAKKE